eukprot:7106618-Prymnesium_polylepis.1
MGWMRADEPVGTDEEFPGLFSKNCLHSTPYPCGPLWWPVVTPTHAFTTSSTTARSTVPCTRGAGWEGWKRVVVEAAKHNH